MNAPRLNGPGRPTSGGDCVIDGDFPPLLKPGSYHLRFNEWATVRYLGRQDKVVLWFTVLDYGPQFGSRLSRWYNAKRLVGPPRLRGRFVLGRSSELLRDYALLTDKAFRRDRIALSHLEPLLLVGEVDTVQGDHRQRRIPKALQYSVIRTLSLGEA